MLSRFRSQVSPAALVISLIALFAAIGGVAGALPGKNTIDSGDIKKNAVKSSDIKNDKVTGADIKESTLNLPEGSLPGLQFQTAGPIQYAKDGFGVVHLRGNATSVSFGNAFATLPAGFRPSATQLFAAVGGFSTPCAVQVGNDGTVKPFGTADCNTLVISVDGITFAAN